MTQGQKHFEAEIITGIRPTGDLTVANYLGAIQPILQLQQQGGKIMVFVADLHALTDNEPSVVQGFVEAIVADYIALGIDPEKTVIYRQSDIAGQVAALTLLLARHTTVAELLRVPTLKDKLKARARLETANALLLLYPVMMSADILLQRAKRVPVGEDQVAHLEITRELAKRFNKKYGKVFPLPEPLLVHSLRILALKGEGKMSKSSPENAIFLTDDDDATVAKKIRSAETAFEGVMNERLESHVLVAKGLSTSEAEQQEIDALLKAHKNGQAVMGQFKGLFTDITQRFLREFQKRRAEILDAPSMISKILLDGKRIASANANDTLLLVQKAFKKR